jgi:hypothetical protein
LTAARLEEQIMVTIGAPFLELKTNMVSGKPKLRKMLILPKVSPHKHMHPNVTMKAPMLDHRAKSWGH